MESENDFRVLHFWTLNNSKIKLSYKVDTKLEGVKVGVLGRGVADLRKVAKPNKYYIVFSVSFSYKIVSYIQDSAALFSILISDHIIERLKKLSKHKNMITQLNLDFCDQLGLVEALDHLTPVLPEANESPIGHSTFVDENYTKGIGSEQPCNDKCGKSSFMNLEPMEGAPSLMSGSSKEGGMFGVIFVA